MLTYLQSDIGKLTIKNTPPRFVLLDDRAACDVLESDIQRAKLTQNWPHDFGGPGKIRSRRPHRGRSALTTDNPFAEGDARFKTTLPGGKGDVYIFTGEKDYQPIVYRYTLPTLKPKPKKKRKPEPGDIDYNPRGHGHNQYTPKDLMVKHGAATFSLKKKDDDPYARTPRIYPAVNRPSELQKPVARSPWRGSDEGAGSSIPREAYKRPKLDDQAGELDYSDDDMIGTGTDNAAYTAPMQSSRGAAKSAFGLDDSSDDEFPVRRPAASPQQIDQPFDPKEVPPNMGYIERNTYKQKLETRAIDKIRSQEDVTRLAKEVADANVKLGEQLRENERQAKEISRQVRELSALKSDLEATQDVAREVDEANAKVQELEAKVNEQQVEIEQVRGEKFEVQTRILRLEQELENVKTGQW